MNINKLFPYLSIRTKLLVAFVSLAAVPLGVGGWYGIRSVTHALTERALNQLKLEVASKAAQIEQFLAEVQRDVLYLGQTSSLQGLLGVSRRDHPYQYARARQQLAEEFVHFSQGKRAYYQLRYLNEKGQEVVRLNYDGERAVIVPQEQLQDKSGRYYFHNAMELTPGEIYVSPMDLNVEFGRIESPPRPVVRYATPLGDSAGRKKGIVVINIFATHMFALVHALPPEGESFLLNPQGEYLYLTKTSEGAEFYDPTRREHISEHYSPGIMSQLVLPNPGAILQPEGEILAHAPIGLLRGEPDHFWILGTALPRDAVLGPIKKIEVVFIIVLTTVTVVAVLIGILAARHFSCPILALRDGAGIIASGHFNHRIRVETNDEIEDLASQFNQMADQLGESVHKMERWNEELQEEVARRTQELRASEEKLRIENRKLDDIISGIGAGLFLLDRSLNIVWANQTFLESHGGPAQILGRPCFQVCGETGQPCRQCTCLETFQDGKIRSSVVERRKDGKEKFYQVVSTPVVDQSGQVFQVLELQLDITDSVLRERAMRKQTAENEKLAALIQLSAGVIHEVANPLAAIRATIEVMEKDLDADKRQHFDGVRRKIDELSSFLRTFSLYAKPRKLELHPCDLRKILQSVVHLLQDEAARRRIVIVERYDEHLAPVQADASKLQQVFLNLVLNAFDAMPDGGQVVLSAQEHADGKPPDKTGEGITVMVEDTGVGIPQDQLGRVFEPFFSMKPSGTGLGLAIVEQIVKAHGARLELDTRMGLGTKFIIHFPSTMASK